MPFLVRVSAWLNMWSCCPSVCLFVCLGAGLDQLRESLGSALLNLKNEDDLKNEGNLKNEGSLKTEDDLRNEDDFNIENKDIPKN